jgi:hypothetical protein
MILCGDTRNSARAVFLSPNVPLQFTARSHLESCGHKAPRRAVLIIVASCFTLTRRRAAHTLKGNTKPICIRFMAGEAFADRDNIACFHHAGLGIRHSTHEKQSAKHKNDCTHETGSRKTG